MNKIIVSNNLRNTIGVLEDQKAFMLAHADRPNANGVIYTTASINRAFANYKPTHRFDYRMLRLERNWMEARKEEPRFFSKNRWRKLNFRQAKKRLTLAAYWE